MYAWTINEPYFPKKGLLKCCTRSSTAQSGNTRFHQLHWSDREMVMLDTFIQSFITRCYWKNVTVVLGWTFHQLVKITMCSWNVRLKLFGEKFVQASLSHCILHQYNEVPETYFEGKEKTPPCGCTERDSSFYGDLGKHKNIFMQENRKKAKIRNVKRCRDGIPKVCKQGRDDIKVKVNIQTPIPASWHPLLKQKCSHYMNFICNPIL